MEKFEKSSRIFVAGHRGLVGSAILRTLDSQGFSQILTAPRSELDLRNSGAVDEFFKKNKPEFVFLAAAKVGGIGANDKFRGDFILENLQIQTNVISAAFKEGTEKLLFLGSSCVYPKLAPQPIQESALLSGPLEPTNEAYAVAKIAGIMTCQSLFKQYGRRFISVMPTNVYGPGDSYDLENSHVLPALILKFHQAKIEKRPEVLAWGTGSPLREFIHCDDLAKACVLCMENYEEPEIINLGSGQEVSIRKLTELVAKAVDYSGKIIWDSTKPDGTPRKLMDSSRIFSMGWKPQIELEEGIGNTYEAFKLSYRKV